MNFLSIAFCLPDSSETVSEASTRINIPAEEARVFEKIFGLKYLPTDLNSTVIPLMMTAAQNCISQAAIDKNQIKWVIHAHTANQVAPFGQSAIREVQRALKLNNALFFGTSMSKCGSAFVAFQIANELFKKLHAEEYILILTGDITFTKIVQYIPGTTIMTDGASAILLGKSKPKNQLIAIAIDLYGEFAGGAWDTKEKQQQFEKNYNKNLVKVIRNVIDEAKIKLSDIKLILPHNVNSFSWRQISKSLDISADKIFLDNIARTAHCFGSDPFINYSVAYEQGKIIAGDYILFVTAGLGATFAAMIFQN